tara:strand:+ start:387 stop:689 length:303 start_codon:yes stop_codon:yes gene_type:complete
MKAITRDSINAFMQNKEFKKQNMIVDTVKNHFTGLYLHNNLIAIRYHDKPKEILIQNCGWFSNTTKERLNGLPNVSIKQKDFVWYLNGKEWNGRQTKILL